MPLSNKPISCQSKHVPLFQGSGAVLCFRRSMKQPNCEQCVPLNSELHLPEQKKAQMLCKVIHCVRCISANTRPNQLRRGNREMGTAISYTECSRTADLVHTTGRSNLDMVPLLAAVLRSCCYDASDRNVCVIAVHLHNSHKVSDLLLDSHLASSPGPSSASQSCSQSIAVVKDCERDYSVLRTCYHGDGCKTVLINKVSLIQVCLLI